MFAVYVLVTIQKHQQFNKLKSIIKKAIDWCKVKTNGRVGLYLDSIVIPKAQKDFISHGFNFESCSKTRSTTTLLVPSIHAIQLQRNSIRQSPNITLLL